MYQIRHQLGTNMVLCKDPEGAYLHWQDTDMVSAMPSLQIVQATTVNGLAELFTLLSTWYWLRHDTIVIVDSETEDVIPMDTKTWKSFDHRVRARIVAKELDVDLEQFNDSMRERGSYFEDMDEQAQFDYTISKMHSPPPPGSIIRINLWGKRHLRRLAEQRTVAAPGAEPNQAPEAEVTDAWDNILSDDPKYMYGIKTTFWQDVAITLGLQAIFNRNKE